MRRMYRGSAATLCALATTAAVGCGSGGSGATQAASTTKAGGGRIAILSSVPNAFDSCKDGAMAKVLEGAGFRPTTYYSKLDPAASSQNLQDALTKGSKGAIYVSQSPPLDLVSLKRLAAANVKTVFNLGPPVAGTSPAVTMPAAFEKVGEVAADELAKLRPGVRRVGLIAGAAGHPSSDLTQKGWLTGLARHGMKAVATLHADFTAPGGTRAAQDMLQAHPDIQALLVLGDDMALAAARVAGSSQGHPVVGDTYAFSKDALRAVHTGKLLALSYTDVAGWGRQIAQAMVAVMTGRPHAKLVTLGPKPVDKANVASITGAC
jgi:ribose transport system substrate-binding protein